MSSPKKQAIELIRVSTERQAAEDRAGIPAQRAINKRTVEAHGLTIIKTIEITDVSGAAVLAAPEIQQLLKEIQNPEIHGVVAREFSRLMRPENFADFILLQAFQETNTVLYLPEGPIDFASKSGRLLGTIRAAIAGLERSEFLERAFAGKEEKRKQGGCPGGSITIPWGVGYDKRRGWFYRPESAKIGEAFQMVLAGDTSINKLSKFLGVTRADVRHILRNPIWTGWRIYDHRAAGEKILGENGRQGWRRRVRRPESETIRVRVIDEPLIAVGEFERAGRILEANQQRFRRARETNDSRFTYGGFLICGECGGPIYAVARTRHDYYICKNRFGVSADVPVTCASPYMRRERLEAKLNTLLGERLLDGEFLDGIARDHAAQSNQRQQRQQVARWMRQIESLKEKRQRILDSYFEGVIAKEDRDARLGVVDREIGTAQENILRDRPAEIGGPAELADYFAPFAEWEFLDREDRRRVLTSMAMELRVKTERVQGVSFLSPINRINEDGRASTFPLIDTQTKQRIHLPISF